MILRRKELIAQELLSRGKIKKVLSCTHVCSLEHIAGNAHDQNEQTLKRASKLSLFYPTVSELLKKIQQETNKTVQRTC